MSASNVTLKVFHQGQLIQTRRLTDSVIKIGRLGSSHLFLDDPQVARMHAVVEVNDRDLRVVDLGSTGGTRINGKPVARSQAMASGDALEIGPYSVFVELDRAIAARPESTAAQRTALDPSLELGAFERTDVPPVAEVMAMYGSTVLDVSHVADRARPQRWPSVAAVGGGVLMLAGLALFAHEAGQDWSTHQVEVQAAVEAGRPIPDAPGWGLGGLGAALALLGLIPFVAGLSARGRSVATSYTVGEQADATFAADLGVEGSLPLVREGRLGFTADMTGRIYTGGCSYDLAELVAAGKARSEGRWFSLPLPPDARCRIESGALSFYVNAVAPGRVVAGRAAADRAFWIYTAGSGLAVASLLALVHLVPDDALSFAMEDSGRGNRFVGYMHQPDVAPEPEPLESKDQEEESIEAEAGTRAAGAEGKMGDPEQRAVSRQYRVKGPKDAQPQIGRNFDPEQSARQAGILGMVEQQTGHFLADAGGGAFTLGQHDEDVWGNLVGTEVGEAHGVGGLGLVGTGRRGGGTGEGTIGLGQVGTMGSLRGEGGSRRLDYGRRGGAAHAGRSGRKPQPRVVISKPTCAGGGCLDKDVIRRVVRSHINEIRHCYNQGLTRDPQLRGRVAVQFRIAANGKVQMSAVAESSLGDAQVGRCVAAAVKRWRFPTSQGASIVTYPFMLSPSV